MPPAAAAWLWELGLQLNKPPNSLKITTRHFKKIVLLNLLFVY